MKEETTRDVFIVTYIDGDSIIDYGTTEKIIGIYTSKTKAVKARAQYAINNDIVEIDEYDELSKCKRQIYHLGYGSLQITKHHIEN